MLTDTGTGMGTVAIMGAIKGIDTANMVSISMESSMVIRRVKATIMQMMTRRDKQFRTI